MTDALPPNLHDDGQPGGMEKEKGNRVTPLRAGQKPEWELEEAMTAFEGGSLAD